MANSSLTLSSLDFDSLKSNFKEFLKTQSAFKDYDFDGSNINVLLDVMSYNSYLNAFYLNMVASEMFLDTAQKYDSVVSHAKELNYVPRSTRSSIAEINVTLTSETLSKKIIIPKGTKFAGTNSKGSFIFVTNETKIVTSANTTYFANNLQIYEGVNLTDSYVVDYDIEEQKFLISNQNVDTNSIVVNVLENNGASNTVFSKAENLFGLNETSDIYFLQGAQDNKFEVIFGDGLFGRKPKNGAIIQISYRVSQGEDGNSVSEFSLVDDLFNINQFVIDVSDIETVSVSSGGSSVESIESIRYAAPRYFATQQRAISSDDYASLVTTKFSGEISDVVIYGGQELEPKLYGRVVVCIKPAGFTVAPNYLKNKVSNFLLPYIALPNRVIIDDPEYLYCSVQSKIQYDSIIGGKSDSEISSDVLNSISNYSTNNLEKFGKDLRYSKIVSAIDNTDINIISNDTEIRIIKRLTPLINSSVSFDIQTNNQIYVELNSDKIGIDYETRYLYSSLISSKFTYVLNGISYPLCFFEDDNKGNIKVYNVVENKLIEIATVGTINYTTGNIVLKDIIVNNYSNHISLYLKPYNKDIFANKNKIVAIDPQDVKLSITEVLR